MKAVKKRSTSWW